MPLYVKKPATASGAAHTMQSQDTISLSKNLIRPKYIPTAAATAPSEHANCRTDKPKNKLSW